MEQFCLGYEMAEIRRGVGEGGEGETREGVGPLADQYNNPSAGA